MFDLEKFKTGKYYVHLPTKEIYDDVMEYLNKNNMTWINGDSLKNNSDSVWNINMSNTCIVYGVVVNNLSYFKESGYKQLEINKYEKGDDNMNEKMKRDLIKLLFEKEFSSHDLENMYEYKGRVIANYIDRTVELVDLLDKIKDKYGIKGNEVADIVIKEFDLKEYKQG